MAAKGIVDVYTNADRVAFALPNIPLDRVPIGWRFSRTVQYEVPSGLQGSDLTKILAGLAATDFYIPSEDEQFAAKEALKPQV
jgi:hypothetical protein